MGSFCRYASWLAIGGLSIGITALMLTASIIQGFQDVISQKLSSFEGDARIEHMLGKSIYLTDPTIDSLMNYSLNVAQPFIRGICMIRSGSEAEGVIIEGTNYLPIAIASENFEKINTGEIILGNNLANILNIRIGDRIFLQSFASSTELSNIPIIKSLTVRYIFYSGLQDYDKTLAFINLEDARKFFGFDANEVSGLIVDKIDSISKDYTLNYPYFLETWLERHSLLFEWISIQRWPAYIMFGLISLVGLVNLIAAIAMIIIEKSAQIGILYSQGLSKNNLKLIFMYQGGFIGGIGSLVGGFLSIIIIGLQHRYKLLNIPSDVYFMDQIPFTFNYPIFILIIILVLFFSVLASWWPARSVDHLKPSKVLRYE